MPHLANISARPAEKCGIERICLQTVFNPQPSTTSWALSLRWFSDQHSLTACSIPVSKESMVRLKKGRPRHDHDLLRGGDTGTVLRAACREERGHTPGRPKEAIAHAIDVFVPSRSAAISKSDLGETQRDVFALIQELKDKQYTGQPLRLQAPSRTALQNRKDRISYGIITASNWGATWYRTIAASLTILFSVPDGRIVGYGIEESELRELISRGSLHEQGMPPAAIGSSW